MLLVPHSKYAVVDEPFGLTLPFNVAEVVLTKEALDVVTIGGDAAADVVKLTIDPLDVPALFCPTTR